jgi:uncharacterized protein (DUF2062 family)
MFKRRSNQPVHHRVGNLIWPRIGFRRSMTYIRHRVGRLHGTPHSIAGGFAAGAAVSITPFVGGHFLLAALLAWLTRCNIVAGLLGTAVGNPWTFPFIWIWTYELGRQMGAGRDLAVEPNFVGIFTDLPGVVVKAVISFDLESTYFENVWAVLWPMMVGSIPTFVMVWLGLYLFLKPLVATYQAKRILRRRRKQEKAREAVRLKVENLTVLKGDVPREAAEMDQVAKEVNG